MTRCISACRVPLAARMADQPWSDLPPSRFGHPGTQGARRTSCTGQRIRPACHATQYVLRAYGGPRSRAMTCREHTVLHCPRQRPCDEVIHRGFVRGWGENYVAAHEADKGEPSGMLAEAMTFQVPSNRGLLRALRALLIADHCGSIADVPRSQRRLSFASSHQWAKSNGSGCPGSCRWAQTRSKATASFASLSLNSTEPGENGLLMCTVFAFRNRCQN